MNHLDEPIPVASTEPSHVPRFIQMDRAQRANEIPNALSTLSLIEQELEAATPDNQRIRGLMTKVNTVVDFGLGIYDESPQIFVNAARANLKRRLAHATNT